MHDDDRSSPWADRRCARQAGVRWLCLAAWCGAAMTAAAKDPPLDPWTDPQWRAVVSGLKAPEVRGLRWSEQLFDATTAGEVSSSQLRRFTFAENGRLAGLDTERSHRGERDERRQWRYQWNAS